MLQVVMILVLPAISRLQICSMRSCGKNVIQHTSPWRCCGKENRNAEILINYKPFTSSLHTHQKSGCLLGESLFYPNVLKVPPHDLSKPKCLKADLCRPQRPRTAS